MGRTFHFIERKAATYTTMANPNNTNKRIAFLNRFICSLSIKQGEKNSLDPFLQERLWGRVGMTSLRLSIDWLLALEKQVCQWTHPHLLEHQQVEL